ncbi:MAG: hypothetical protein HY291_10350 [Planctomycetes bacterium]|nr:hypothetical protein [Planctomycetota bacterium]
MPRTSRCCAYWVLATLSIVLALPALTRAEEEDITPAKTPDKPKAKDDPKAAPVEPPKPLEKPKPAFEKGKAATLFPADRDSKTVDHQSPAMQQGQKSGINETKYAGWSYMGQKLDGWSVKGGVLDIDGQCALTLDGYPFKDFDLKIEIELTGASGLGIMLGSGKDGISLLGVLPNAVLPGTWDQTKQGNNVNFDNKAAKPLPKGGGWISLRINVAQGWVEVSADQKSIFKDRLANPVQFSQFGFLSLGVSGNKDPKIKVKNATITGN